MSKFIDNIIDFESSSIERYDNYKPGIISKHPYIVNKQPELICDDQRIQDLFDQDTFELNRVFISEDDERKFSYFPPSVAVTMDEHNGEYRFVDTDSGDMCINDVSLYTPPKNRWANSDVRNVDTILDNLFYENETRYFRYRFLKNHDAFITDKLKANDYEIKFNDDLDAFMYFAGCGTTTDMHFDGVPRLVTVLRGQKKVILFPPEDSPNLYPTANYQFGYAHSFPFRRRSLLSGCLHKKEVLEKYVSQYPLFSRTKPLSFTINEGETLFLPECWWHYFHSTGDVTINVIIDLEEDLTNRLDKSIDSCAFPYSPQERYVPLINRSYKTATRGDATCYGGYMNRMKEIKGTKGKWKNYSLTKDPYTLQIYAQLLQDLQPKTILEIGSGSGGSAVWMRDQVNLLGLQCEVITLDNDRALFQAGDEKDISFYCLDGKRVEDFFSDENNKNILKNLQHPVLLIDSSGEEVNRSLSFFSGILDTGDYVVVENTLNIAIYRELVTFTQDHPEFLVDTYYCDFYGYNSSMQINSILRKE